MEEQISFLDGGFSVSEEAQQTFFPQLQLPQQIIDEALCMGFNDRDSRKIICAYFMKDKPTTPPSCKKAMAPTVRG